MSSEWLPTAMDQLIVEGIVVTLDSAGQPNIAPMGPRVDRTITRLSLRPFQSSHTFTNLKATGCGVFHVTDDVELLARAAVGRLDSPPPLVPVAGFRCPRLADACRWFAFEAIAFDELPQRANVECKIVSRGEQHPFLGFNRAKHAVVEASILATRVGIVANDEIQAEMRRLAALVGKTGGAQEHRAFDFLREYIESQISTAS